MAQITDSQRALRIKQLLADLNKQPPEKHEVERLPSSNPDAPLLCQVISMPVDEVLLNHRSHRLRSQLTDDPEWQAVKNSPHGEAAQRIIERHVREARTKEQFNSLRESLQREGQTDPGVITHEGVLINANTRAVAFREMDSPRYIRVAVLPETIQPEEIALMELSLQMRKELKTEYSLTNGLLFIEELSIERKLSNAYIADKLRLYPDRPKKGEEEVAQRLRLLDLLRQMKQIPSTPLPLSFFDDPAHALSREQLRGILAKYTSLQEHDPAEAERYLESVLLAVAVGVTAVHRLRDVDASFMADYMVPHLSEDELVGPVTSQLVTRATAEPSAAPRGVDLLRPREPDAVEDVDVRLLVNAVTQRDKTVKVPNSNFTLERDDLRDAIKAAITTGARDKSQDDKAANGLMAPLEAVKGANTQITRCMEALKAVANTPGFDDHKKRSVEAAYKKLKRGMKNLDAALVKADVLGS